MQALGSEELVLMELLAALDDLPRRRLGMGYLRLGDDYCVIGALMRWRGIEVGDRSRIRPSSVDLGASGALISELMDFNDWIVESPHGRWRKMREWIVRRLELCRIGRE